MSNNTLAAFRNPLLARDATARPEIQITKTIREMARAIRANIPLTEELFFLGDALTCITAELNVSAGGHRAWQKKTTPMTPALFVSWVEKYISFYTIKASGEKVYQSITRQMAELVLASTEFRDPTPKVNEILSCRLPIHKLDKAGRLLYALADKGYTINSNLYSFDNAPLYDTKCDDLATLRYFFEDEFGDFAFEGVIPREGGLAPDMTRSRNASMTVACIMAQYLRHHMRVFPFIIINANTQGCGKSHLASAILTPFYGHANNTVLPDNEEERRKTLAAAALSGDPYIFFDNQNTLASNALEGAITQPELTGRNMHAYTNYKAVNRMQMIATGNHVKVNKDMERRGAFIDMAYNGDLRTRTWRKPLTVEKIESRTWQRTMLTWCDNAYRAWLAAGTPAYCNTSSMHGFGDFVKLAGNITVHLGFCDPFAAREHENSGDVRSAAFIEFLVYLASRIVPNFGNQAHSRLRRVFDTSDLLTIADDEKRTSTMLPDAHDKRSAIGQRIAKIQNNYMTDLHGREFRLVKHGHAKYRQEYVLEILTEPTQISNLPPHLARAIEPSLTYDTTPLPELKDWIILDEDNILITPHKDDYI